MVVAVEGERISYVGHPAALSNGADGADVAELSFPGCTILPGLIDPHVHLIFSAGIDPWGDMGRENDYQLMLRAAKNAATLLRAGVTTVRDCGARNNTIFDFRAGVEMGLTPSPRLLVAGRPVTRTGGHLRQFGGCADGVDEIRRTIRALFDQGADFIKVPATSGFGSRAMDAYEPAYSDEELGAAIDEAHRLGRKITVHVTGTLGALQAVKLGVDSIEHLPMMPGPDQWEFDEVLAREVRDRGIYVSATISAGYRAHEYIAAGNWAVPRPGRLSLETRIQNMRRLYESGVQLITGTDSGARMTAFDESVALEMETMVSVGMPALEAIAAGTSRAATAIDMADKVGSLETGKLADILVVEGNPAQDISAIRNVVAVFQGGKQVHTTRQAQAAPVGVAI
jgi:imidazolonepropionase-like amidohydrolase